MHPATTYELAMAWIADLRRQAQRDAANRAAARAIQRAAAQHAPDPGQPPPGRPTAPLWYATVDVAAQDLLDDPATLPHQRYLHARP
jgi:hypothetical protein